MQIPRCENGVLAEALCKIVHHEPFAVLDGRAFAPAFRYGTNRTLKAVDKPRGKQALLKRDLLRKSLIALAIYM
jgi:hypothetical protein